jgi:hypothetical protein
MTTYLIRYKLHIVLETANSADPQQGVYEMWNIRNIPDVAIFEGQSPVKSNFKFS